MKGTSKVIMGATLVMVVTLAMVLGLALVFLAELYCSLLLRRRRQFKLSTTSPATATASAILAQSPHHQSAPNSLRSFYSHGVLNPPRNILFPKQEDEDVDFEKQKHHSDLLQFLEKHQTLDPKTQFSISSPLQPASTSVKPNPIQQVDCSTSKASDDTQEEIVYISNPVYENEMRVMSKDETPFETPDTSPSRLESGNSSEDEVVQCSGVTITPPLSPMKELPKQGCSVSLRSFGTSGSDSNDNNGESSSSSGSPSTSPSW